MPSGPSSSLLFPLFSPLSRFPLPSHPHYPRQVEEPPIGADIEFVRAERSAFLWNDADVGRITRSGARVHLLPNSGHWVHIDNPEGLVEILATRFGAGSAEPL